MRQAAFQLCAPSITVRKLVDLTPDPAADDRQSRRSGWEMTATADPTPAELGAAAGRNRQHGDRDHRRRRVRQVPVDDDGAGLDLGSIEEVPEAVQPGFVNDPSATSAPTEPPTPRRPAAPRQRHRRWLHRDGLRPGDRHLPDGQPRPAAPVDPDREVDQRGRRRQPAGPFVPIGDPVAWTYVVTNTGNVTLLGASTSPTTRASPSLPGGTLAARARHDLHRQRHGDRAASTRTSDGQRGRPVRAPTSATPTRRTTSGAAAGIDIEKATNGADADDPPGPVRAVGDP